MGLGAVIRARHLLLASLLLALGSISNTTISHANVIISGDGDEDCRISPFSHNVFANCPAVPISVHPAWQPNNPNGNGAQWISYADTGYLGQTFVPTPNECSLQLGCNTIMQIRQRLTGIEPGDYLVLDVWADDTVNLQLRYERNGAGFSGAPVSSVGSLIQPVFAQDICADRPPGCQTEDRAQITYLFTEQNIIEAGGSDFFLFFSVFQVGAGAENSTNPFGLLYSGSFQEPPPVVYETVPEPTPLLLLLGPLAMLWGRKRREASPGPGSRYIEPPLN